MSLVLTLTLLYRPTALFMVCLSSFTIWLHVCKFSNSIGSARSPKGVTSNQINSHSPAFTDMRLQCNSRPITCIWNMTSRKSTLNAKDFCSIVRLP